MNTPIKVSFVPGFSFHADNSPAARAERCDAVAEHFDVKASVASRRGKHGAVRALSSLRVFYAGAADEARGEPFKGPESDVE
jgi:hypothetical protein